jgi:Flp pilus assembly protein TadD
MPQVDPILALAFIKSAQTHAPHDPMLWYWRVVSHLRAGDRPSADAALARLQSLAPAWPETVRLATYMKETPP